MALGPCKLLGVLRHEPERQALRAEREVPRQFELTALQRIPDHLVRRQERLIAGRDLADQRVLHRIVDHRPHLVERGLDHVAILRLEQVYPFPQQELQDMIAPYRNLLEVTWCQEEPQNQGVWFSSQHRMRQVVRNHNRDLYLEYAGRESSAAPAAGYNALHLAQQEKLLRDALGIGEPRWPNA